MLSILLNGSHCRKPLVFVGAITFYSVSATEAEIANFTCFTEVINEVIPTVSHLNVDGPMAAAKFPVETDLPGDFNLPSSTEG